MAGGVWTGDDPENLRRARPRPGTLRMPRRMRRAEVVCPDAGDRPAVLAILYPRDVQLAALEVLTEEEDAPPLGGDFTVRCRCGSTHNIDGAQLRSEVMANPVTRGRAPTIDVRRVTPPESG